MQADQFGSPGGVPVPLVGTMQGLDIDVYHSLPGISKSGLDEIDRSPAHYFGARLDPRRPPPKDRAGQLEGTLTHCAVLEPDWFSRRYVVVPADAPRRPSVTQWTAKNSNADSIAAKAWWTDFNERTGGAVVITNEQYETAMRQADNIRALPQVAEVLVRGRAEVSAMWRDWRTGRHCRCRPDWVAEFDKSHVALLDVKTCSDASPDEFKRQIARKRYHVQDAFYTDGYALAANVDVLAFVFVAVEGEWPFVANALMLDERGQDQGRADYRRNLDTYSECMRTEQWPAYGNEIQLINLPDWAFTDEPIDLSFSESLML